MNSVKFIRRGRVGAGGGLQFGVRNGVSARQGDRVGGDVVGIATLGGILVTGC